MSPDQRTATSAAAGLPSHLIVQRAGEGPSSSLSPTDRTRFLFADVPGQPEFIDAVGGRGDSAPLHRHPWATWELIIEGSVRFVVDDEEILLGAGDFIYTPPNAAHTFVVESERARMVGFNHPAPRFASLQRQAEEIFAAPGPPDMRRVAKLAAEHDVEVLGPPMTPRG
jgi:mannose-6-phosphate isomerase-like protein (cupin superfamily)